MTGYQKEDDSFLPSGQMCPDGIFLWDFVELYFKIMAIGQVSYFLAYPYDILRLHLKERWII